jgi:hypothetical protein
MVCLPQMLKAAVILALSAWSMGAAPASCESGAGYEFFTALRTSALRSRSSCPELHRVGATLGQNGASDGLTRNDDGGKSAQRARTSSRGCTHRKSAPCTPHSRTGPRALAAFLRLEALLGENRGAIAHSAATRADGQV